jgi:phosphoribosylamine--glycine ligase
MNICIIGSGGRESALAWKLKQSPTCDKLYIIPGNGGSNEYGINISLDISDLSVLASFLIENEVSMLVVGPEDPLVNGIQNKLSQIPELKDLQIIGPSSEGAMLEGSKAFAKEFMKEYAIPTAAYRSFAREEELKACQYIDAISPPYVLKADGLAAGKGVLILDEAEQAKEEIKAMLSGKFGEASANIVIEEFLDGIEFSVFVVTDGNEYKILPVAKDYKRRGEGDSGLNTGGMGSISPVPFVDEELMKKVEQRIIRPTIHGIKDRHLEYKGFIFFGLINVEGNPYVIEYNCRMGDPETEVVIPRLKNDLVELLSSVYSGGLGKQTIVQDDRTAACVIMVSDGYPGSYEKGKEIQGLENVRNSLVFHAGTKVEKGALLSNGGRVIAVTSLAASRSEALKKSYNSIEKITFEGKCFRNDIGFDL